MKGRTVSHVQRKGQKASLKIKLSGLSLPPPATAGDSYGGGGGDSSDGWSGWREVGSAPEPQQQPLRPRQAHWQPAASDGATKGGGGGNRSRLVVTAGSASASPPPPPPEEQPPPPPPPREDKQQQQQQVKQQKHQVKQQKQGKQQKQQAPPPPQQQAKPQQPQLSPEEQPPPPPPPPPAQKQQPKQQPKQQAKQQQAKQQHAKQQTQAQPKPPPQQQPAAAAKEVDQALPAFFFDVAPHWQKQQQKQQAAAVAPAQAAVPCLPAAKPAQAAAAAAAKPPGSREPDVGRGRRGSRSRGRHSSSSRSSSRGRHSSSSRSSSRSGSRGGNRYRRERPRESDFDRRPRQRSRDGWRRRRGRSNDKHRGQAHGKRNGRRSRSPLRRRLGGDAISKRRPAASAAGPANPQLQLACLVDSMGAEAASLQRQLSRLAIADGDGSGAKLPGGEPPWARGSGTSSAGGPNQAVVVERQLAALSSKLGQLSLCLQSMHLQQQQQGGVAPPWAAAAGDDKEEGEIEAPEAGRTYLSFDTNVYMDHSKLIRECWKRLAASGSSSIKILVPLAVVRELDGLKKCLLRSFWARKAIRRLSEMQAGGGGLVRGQREDELRRGVLRRNDDGILDCLLLFAERGAQCELVSKDINLCTRARIEGLRCCGTAALQQRITQLLEAEAAASSRQAQAAASLPR